MLLQKKKNSTGGIIYTEHECITHSSRGWAVEGQVTGKLEPAISASKRAP